MRLYLRLVLLCVACGLCSLLYAFSQLVVASEEGGGGGGGRLVGGRRGAAGVGDSAGLGAPRGRPGRYGAPASGLGRAAAATAPARAGGRRGGLRRPRRWAPWALLAAPTVAPLASSGLLLCCSLSSFSLGPGGVCVQVSCCLGSIPTTLDFCAFYFIFKND